MAITAKDVQTLREMTGVGMMDCKKALTEAEGNMDKAVEILREKGLAASQKKAGRIAAEGMAYATVVNGVGVVVEVNAETDFVGKNEKFVDFVKGVAAVVAANKPADLDALMALSYGNGRTVQEEQQEMVLVIGENIKVRRFAFFTDGISVPYVHAGGKIGVLVNLETGLTAEQVETVGKDVAMQIAALNPRFWDKSQAGEQGGEGGAGRGGAGDGEPPVVALHDAPGNGQPQAVAAPAPVPGGVRPVETLEEVGQVLRRDGNSGVGH